MIRAMRRTRIPGIGQGMYRVCIELLLEGGLSALRRLESLDACLHSSFILHPSPFIPYITKPFPLPITKIVLCTFLPLLSLLIICVC